MIDDPAIGSSSHAGTLCSRDFCTRGREMILSSVLTIRNIYRSSVSQRHEATYQNNKAYPPRRVDVIVRRDELFHLKLGLIANSDAVGGLVVILAPFHFFGLNHGDGYGTFGVGRSFTTKLRPKPGHGAIAPPKLDPDLGDEKVVE